MSETFKMLLLPAKKGTCALCCVDHSEEFPHDQSSMFYKVRFALEHGRQPTWADAVAHTDDEMMKFWKESLVFFGHWSDTENPIAEPYKLSE